MLNIFKKEDADKYALITHGALEELRLRQMEEIDKENEYEEKIKELHEEINRLKRENDFYKFKTNISPQKIIKNYFNSNANFIKRIESVFNNFYLRLNTLDGIIMKNNKRINDIIVYVNNLNIKNISKANTDDTNDIFNKELMEQNITIQNLRNQLIEESTKSRKVIARLEGEIEEYKSRKTENFTNEGKYIQEIVSIKHEKEELLELNKQLNSQIFQLHDDIESRQSQIHNLTNQIYSLTNRIEELEYENDRIKADKTLPADQKKYVRSNSDDIKFLKEELEEKEKLYDQSVQKHVQDKEKLVLQLNSVTFALNEKENRINRLELSIEQLKTSLRHLTSKNQRDETELKHQISISERYEQNNAELQDELNLKSKSIIELQKEYDSFTRSLSSLLGCSNKNDIHKKITDLLHQVIDLEKMNQDPISLQSEIQKEKENSRVLEEKISQLKERLQKQIHYTDIASRGKNNEQITILKAQNQQLLDENDALSNKNKELRKLLAEAEAEKMRVEYDGRVSHKKELLANDSIGRFEFFEFTNQQMIKFLSDLNNIIINNMDSTKENKDRVEIIENLMNDLRKPFTSHKLIEDKFNNFLILIRTLLLSPSLPLMIRIFNSKSDLISISVANMFAEIHSKLDSIMLGFEYVSDKCTRRAPRSPIINQLKYNRPGYSRSTRIPIE